MYTSFYFPLSESQRHHWRQVQEYIYIYIYIYVCVYVCNISIQYCNACFYKVFVINDLDIDVVPNWYPIYFKPMMTQAVKLFIRDTGSRQETGEASSNSTIPMGLLLDTQNCGLRMCRECRERFSRHRLQRKLLVSDPGTHHGTCVTHVPWCLSGSLIRGGGENVPSIPGACTTRNFTYLARGPCEHYFNNYIWSPRGKYISQKKMCYFIVITVFAMTLANRGGISSYHSLLPLYVPRS